MTEEAFEVHSRYFSAKSADPMMMGGPAGKRHFTLTAGDTEGHGEFYFCATRFGGIDASDLPTDAMFCYSITIAVE